MKADHEMAKGLCCGVLALAVLWGAAPPAAHAADAVTMKAVSIDGKVYVQAEAMQDRFGGEGKYNPKTQTYSYTPNDLAAVVQKVSPSVVSIVKRNREGTVTGFGTGVVVRQDGWIVTNEHVIEGALDVDVVTSDGTVYSAKKWYADEALDLAILQIKASGLKPLAFTKQAPQVGDPVFVMGTPESMLLRSSVTTGVVSGIERGIGSLHSYKLIQTDAAINSGNSGGPLMNMKGEVIGINVSKLATDQIDNIAFAIPADTVEMAIRHFMKYGKIKRADLGLELEEHWAASDGQPGAEPLQVMSVRSAAAKKAGIREGDVLYAINGRQVITMTDVNETLKLRLPGQRVSLTMQSDGDLVERPITLVEG
ncbi:trypsin-like peptidase domain-containing protein [Paenibacillus thiaminolyticus]|uniref:S1C family serine protease n=1 Tax=Paenibacillus thiaminolyticus TaxID=49283 RepID=UPI00232F440B|nr:trypsin-like peptidase domain-containing protein [Paenibacillus thiaminolyticus]WCF07878.1 trypsin-like peptidase domain-containing protein [Paenibacillus thiaminolyticus]